MGHKALQRGGTIPHTAPARQRVHMLLGRPNPNTIRQVKRMAKQPRFKDRLRIGQTITKNSDSETVAVIRQIWRKDKRVHIVFKKDGSDTTISFSALQQWWSCPDWTTFYVER